MFKLIAILFLRILSIFLPVSLLGLVSRAVPTLTAPNGPAIALSIGIFALAVLLSLLINFLAYSFKDSSLLNPSSEKTEHDNTLARTAA